MSGYRDLSIKWKLTWIILGTSTAALLLACAAFVGYELITFRDGMVQEASTLADVIGENSKAALTFQDPEAAQGTLAALGNEEQVQVPPPAGEEVAGTPYGVFFIGEAISHENLTIFPISSKTPKNEDRFITLDEGLAAGTVKIIAVRHDILQFPARVLAT